MQLTRKQFSILNALISLSGIAALFYALTNGIPFQQLGWISHHGGRGEIRAAVVIFVFSLSVIRFGFPNRFFDLGVIRFFRFILNFPLGVSAVSLAVLYAAVQIAVGVVSHLALNTRGYDLGIFAQAVWTTFHGDFLYSSLKGGICLLGDHVSPILLAAVPFYALWPDPRILIVLQSIALAACLFAVAAIAWKKTGDRYITFIFMLLYFFDRPTRSALRSDFRPEALVQPFIYLAFIFLEKSKRGLFLLALFTVLLGKENMPGIAFVMGLYAIFVKRWNKTGAAIMVMSLAVFYAETQWFAPLMNTAGGGYEYQSYYSSAGSHGFGGGVIGRLFSKDTLEYLPQMLGPFLFLPFFHPATFLLALPVLMQNLLSAYEPMRSMNYHYAYGLTPFLYISSIYAWSFLLRRFSWFAQWNREIGALLLAAGLIFSAPSDYHHFMERAKFLTPQSDWIRGELAKIDSSDVVVTHNRFIAQIPNRKYIYPLSFPEILETVSKISKNRKTQVLLSRSYWEEEQASGNISLSFEKVLEILKENSFSLHEERGGFYWFTRAAS